MAFGAPPAAATTDQAKPSADQDDDAIAAPRRVTPALLKQLVKEQKLYTSWELNDKLYLHYRGLDKIEGLHQWSGLRALWLEGNGLSKIEGLDQMPELRTVYLHQNCIRRIENLEACPRLACVQLSNNWVRKIENLSGLPRLSTLKLADNRLRDADDVRHLLSCQRDRARSSEQQAGRPGVAWLEAMPQLAVLQLQGNPLVGKVKQYRRTVISRCKSLTYLDDRPVFAEERLCVEAYVGGLEAESDVANATRRMRPPAQSRCMKALMRGGRADTGTEESAEDASVNSERSALSPTAELPAASMMHARARARSGRSVPSFSARRRRAVEPSERQRPRCATRFF